MLATIREKITAYEAANDVHQHALITEAAAQFLKLFPSEAASDEALSVGIKLVRHLNSLGYLGSMREYENNYTLQNEILSLKIRVFKRCIPASYSELRGLTELLMGMKEDALK